MDVIVRESDLVILTVSKTISPVSIYTRLRLLKNLHGPVVMAIARRRPTGAAVEFSVGNGYTTTCWRCQLVEPDKNTGSRTHLICIQKQTSDGQLEKP